MKKISILVSVAALLIISGCSTVETPMSIPVVAIVDARDLGEEVEATIRYSDATPGRQELNVGLGYKPSASFAKNLPPSASGFYEVLHKEILRSVSGEVVVRIKKDRLDSPFDGSVSVNISEYPHGPSWSPMADDRYEITPN